MVGAKPDHPAPTTPTRATHGRGYTVAPWLASSWSPTAEYVERANVTRFMRRARHRDRTRSSSGARSRTSRGSGTPWSRTSDPVVRRALRAGAGHLGRTRVGTLVRRGPDEPRPGQCVDRWAERTPDAIAVRWEGEDGDDADAGRYAELRRHDRPARAGVCAALGVRRRRRRRRLPADAARDGRGRDGRARSSARSGSRSSAGSAPTRWPRAWPTPARGCSSPSTASRRKGAAVPMKAIADGRGRRRLRRARRRPAAGSATDDASVGRGPRSSIGTTLGDGTRPPASTAEPLDAEHPLFLGYTSGTTGPPEGRRCTSTAASW